MRLLRVVAAVLALGGLAAAVSGPNDRQITDPNSVISATNPNAKPVAVEDLYVTRLINSAALSPNGTEVAVTTTPSDRPSRSSCATAPRWVWNALPGSSTTVCSRPFGSDSWTRSPMRNGPDPGGPGRLTRLP